MHTSVWLSPVVLVPGVQPAERAEAKEGGSESNLDSLCYCCQKSGEYSPLCWAVLVFAL